jgi:hypothetical protein
MVKNMEMLYRHCFLNFVLEYAIMTIQEKNGGLKANKTCHLLVEAHGINVLGESLILP